MQCYGIQNIRILHFSQICGYVLGYKFWIIKAFTGVNDLDGVYVDGVSITVGNPRTHVWSYAAGFVSTPNSEQQNCLRNEGVYAGTSAPSFVGNDYYCEGSTQPGTSWETGDILWDGKQCEGIEGPCCNNHPRLPWFTKDLKMHTLADIDVRLCISDRAVNLNVGIESLEFYVK